MAKRITVDDYVIKDMEEYRELWKRYDELSGCKRSHSNDISFLISFAVSAEIESLKESVRSYERKKANAESDGDGFCSST